MSSVEVYGYSRAAEKINVVIPAGFCESSQSQHFYWVDLIVVKFLFKTRQTALVF